MQPRCFSAPPGSAPVEPRCAGPSPRCSWRRPCRDRGSWHCARRGAVKRYGFRIVVAARLRFRHEMVMAIPAAHERGTILAGELRHVSREIADGKADAPVVRRAGSRACPREGGGRHIPERLLLPQRRLKLSGGRHRQGQPLSGSTSSACPRLRIGRSTCCRISPATRGSCSAEGDYDGYCNPEIEALYGCTRCSRGLTSSKSITPFQ
jgi:hypothetical protein